MMPPRGMVLVTMLVGMGSVACGPKRVSWEEARPPEVLVESLPPGAQLAVDGVEVGRTPLSLPVRDRMKVYRMRLERPGFEPMEAEVAGSRLAGGRVDLVMRPTGFGAQRTLDAGEPTGLAQAGAVLLRGGYARDALAFARASVEARDNALAHRIAGDAYRQLGDRNRAIQEYSIYVTMAPDAPDRAAIEKAISAARGDISVPPPKLD